jgi:hypothetical protein
MSHPLDHLGLDENADERAVKRAYAGLLRRHRPDEDPDAFQSIHDAYRNALAWLRDDGRHHDGRHDEATHDDAIHPDDAPGHTGDAAWLPARHTVATDDPVRDAQAFDADAFLAGCFEAAFDHDPERIARWLQTQPALWSLQRKPAIGAWLLQTMATDEPPMSVRSFDRIAAFFGYDDPADRHRMPMLHALRERLGDDWNARCVSVLPTAFSLWPVPAPWPPVEPPRDRDA